jgi:hypothetical protein
MTLLGTLSDAALRRTSYFLDGELLSYKSVLIGAGQPDPRMPNAFLVEQAAHRDLPAHFHGYGQFQVVVAGDGQLGGHDLRPLSVHYAGQRTTYGPIRPGAAGLSYLTLRPRTEGPAFFMPQSRHLRDSAIPRYEVFSKQHDFAGAVERVPAAEMQIVPMLESTPVGLAAWLVRIPPGMSASAPPLPGGSGRYHVMVGGELELPQGPADWLATLWTDPDETLQLKAGDKGAEVLVVQFPGDACKHPLPPASSLATPTDLNLALRS